MLSDDTMRIDDDGAVAFALVLANCLHNSRNVFVVGVGVDAAADVVSSLSSSSSIYLHSDV